MDKSVLKTLASEPVTTAPDLSSVAYYLDDAVSHCVHIVCEAEQYTVYRCFASMYDCTSPDAWCPGRPEEGAQSLSLKETEGCELSCEC